MNRSVYSPLIRFIQVPSIRLLNADIVNHDYECGAGGVMLIEGTTDEALTSRSKDLFSRLKKETKVHKRPIRYSHIETAQYEKFTGTTIVSLIFTIADVIDTISFREPTRTSGR